MSFAVSFIAPLALLIPAAGPVQELNGPNDYADAMQQQGSMPEPHLLPAFDPPQPFAVLDGFAALLMVADSFRVPNQHQVRIEEHFTIRITPLAAPVQPTMLVGMPRQPAPQRLKERNFGKCVSVSGIAGVNADTNNRLRFFLRDQRMVTASLDRSCSARDFYSGFYMAKNADGQICINRDTLRARNGANCKLTKLKQLVIAGN